MPPDTIKRKHMRHAQQAYLQAMRERGIGVLTQTSGDFACAVREMLRTVRPHTFDGLAKVRVGGEFDGGYVMAEPGHGGVVYSFGVSDYSPWDLAMAERGFRVFQYDGTIDREPDTHPNIFFNKFNVSAAPLGETPARTLREILLAHGHEDEREIILQMDVEGAEWDFFASASRDDMLRFKQLIVEFHGTGIWVHRYAVLRKILETHIPIHAHYNNTGEVAHFPDDGMLYGGHVMEITYVRADVGLTAKPCGEYYPTKWDNPNDRTRPDIPIGYFDILLDEPASGHFNFEMPCSEHA